MWIEKVTLPLRWLLIAVTIGALPLVWTAAIQERGRAGGGVSLFCNSCVPLLVQAVYVRPNEISIERPYIERHIAGNIRRVRPESQRHGACRLRPTGQANGRSRCRTPRCWITFACGICAPTTRRSRRFRRCAPTTRFPDTDVDRYFLNGHIKQVLLSPREIDVSQLSAEASQSWINPRFIYTHGFGVVVSEVNKITPDGLPVLLIENAPPEIKIAGISADAAGNLLRRENAGSGVCAHGARRVRLSFRRSEQIFDLSGQRGLSGRIVSR